MMILDGRQVAEIRRNDLKIKIQKFQAHAGRSPHLRVFLVGDDPASQLYVRNKQRACAKVGIQSSLVALDTSASSRELLIKVREASIDNEVDGILIQLPLPKSWDARELIESIDPLKDVDGFTLQNVGSLFVGTPSVVPCTPLGIMNLLEYYKISVAGMRAVVVGRSNIVGKPMAQLLSLANATVTVCHSRTRDLESHTREADLVVVAAGFPNLLGASAFKKGAVVVDVGLHRDANGNLTGDVKALEVKDTVRALTPVPGGVGPMTVQTLLENTVTLAMARLSQNQNKGG